MALTISVGPPAKPLPHGWWIGLSHRRVYEISSMEATGTPRVQPTLHDKGYVRLYLGRGHPYADSGGTQYLHRWLMMRHLGQRLEPSEHVHHKNGDKETVDLAEFLVMLDHAHGHYHWHWHGTCKTNPIASEDVIYDGAAGGKLIYEAV